MRRQNPPQSSIDRARSIEKYLSPTSIAVIYGIGAIIYAVGVTLVFALMVGAGAITVTQTSIMVVALIGLVPATFIFLAVFLRPNDPVSQYIKGAADSFRKPMPVAPDDCTFKVHLMDGETLCVRMCFFYPANSRSNELKERLYTVVHGALSQDFSTRVVVPTYKEIETTIDKPLGLLAEEREIPVFYSEIRDIFHSHEESPAQMAYINTGTWS